MAVQSDVKSYDYGSRLTHLLRVKVDDSLADPTTLVVYLTTPAGAILGPFTPVKRAQGVYTYTKTYRGNPPSSMQGDWTIAWVGTGDGEGAKERKFHIRTSLFTYTS